MENLCPLGANKVHLKDKNKFYKTTPLVSRLNVLKTRYASKSVLSVF